MSYIELNKRQLEGKRLEYEEFMYAGQQAKCELIEIARPYANGVKYTVNENSRSAFCSCGLFTDLQEAKRKYFLMLRNCDVITDAELRQRTRQPLTLSL